MGNYDDELFEFRVLTVASNLIKTISLVSQVDLESIEINPVNIAEKMGESVERVEAALNVLDNSELLKVRVRKNGSMGVSITDEMEDEAELEEILDSSYYPEIEYMVMSHAKAYGLTFNEAYNELLKLGIKTEMGIDLDEGLNKG